MRHFCDAAVAVDQHTLDPARIGQAPAHDAGNFFGHGACDGCVGAAGIDVIERRRLAQEVSRRCKTTDKIGHAIAVQEVALSVILRMHQCICTRHARLEFMRGRYARLIAAVRMRCGAEVGGPEIGSGGPGGIEDDVGGSSTIGSRRAAKRPRETVAPPARRGQWIPRVVLIALGDQLHGHVEECDLRRENVAEKSRDPQRHVDARLIEFGKR